MQQRDTGFYLGKRPLARWVPVKKTKKGGDQRTDLEDGGKREGGGLRGGGSSPHKSELHLPVTRGRRVLG